MKKILLALVIFLVLAATTALCITTSNLFNAKTLRASGKLVTKTIALPEFHELHSARGIKVVLTERNTDKISIEADDNIIEYVQVVAVKGRLDISIDKAINQVSNETITVIVPTDGDIAQLDASSASKIVGMRPLTASTLKINASSSASIQIAAKADKCSIDTSSAARIEAALQVTECNIDMSSASKVKLAGTATQGSISLSSAAKLSAEQFTVAELTISTSSGAKAEVNCIKDLDADASSGSSIIYSGDCSVKRNTSSGASITKN